MYYTHIWNSVCVTHWEAHTHINTSEIRTMFLEHIKKNWCKNYGIDQWWLMHEFGAECARYNLLQYVLFFLMFYRLMGSSYINEQSSKLVAAFFYYYWEIVGGSICPQSLSSKFAGL